MSQKPIPKKYIVPTVVLILSGLAGYWGYQAKSMCMGISVVIAVVYTVVRFGWGNANILHALRDLALLEAGLIGGIYFSKENYVAYEMDALRYPISYGIVFATVVLDWVIMLIIVFFRDYAFQPADSPRCDACGYNLTDHVGSHCPECGQSIIASFTKEALSRQSRNDEN